MIHLIVTSFQQYAALGLIHLFHPKALPPLYLLLVVQRQDCLQSFVYYPTLTLMLP